MAVKFANLASSTLASSLSNTATSISVTSSSSFPTLGSGDYFYASIGEGSGSEIVKVTGVSSNTFTVVRGQDGTSAQNWSSGSVIALRVVAAALDDIAEQAQTAADTESVSISGDTMTGALTVPSITVGDGHTIGDDADDNLEITGSAGENVIIKSGVSTYLRTNGNSNALVIGSSLTSYFYGHVVPNTGGARDLGASGTRWRDIYTGTLNASSDINSSGHLQGTKVRIGSTEVIDTNADFRAGNQQYRYLHLVGGATSTSEVPDTEAMIAVADSSFSGLTTSSDTGWLVYRPRVSSSSGRSGHAFYTGSPSTLALKIDSSQNATFAGTITSGAITSSGDIDAAGDIYTGSANSRFKENQLKFNASGASYIDQATTGQTLYFRTSNVSSLDTTWLEANSAGQATFGGHVIVDGGITSLGISQFQRDIRSAGQIRATGWYNDAASTDYTGLAFEIGVSGSKAYGLSYNRSTASYGPMRFDATNFEFVRASNFNIENGNLQIGGNTVISSSRAVSATSVGVTNIVTNKIVKFNGTILDDSNLTDDGSNLTIAIPTVINSGSDGILSLNQATTGWNYIQYQANGTRKFYVGNDATDGFVVGSDDSGKLFKFQNFGNISADTADISLAVGKKLYFGGGSHTYISEDIDDRLRFFTGGTEFMRFTEGTSNIATFYAPVSFSGNVTVNGSLSVLGTTTTIDTATLNVEDKNITLNYSTGDSSATADGAGITIQDGVNSSTDVTMTWSQAGNNFNFSHSVNTLGYLQHSSFLYSRNNLLVLNSAGNGWNTWATRSNGQFNLSVGTISSGSISTTGTITGSKSSNSGYIHKLTNSDTGTSAYTEFIVESGTQELRIGTSQNYASGQWDGSWVYADTGDLFLKSGPGHVKIYAGDTVNPNWTFNTDGSIRRGDYNGTTFVDSSRNITAGTISSGAITSSGSITGTTVKETDGGDGFTEIGTSNFGYFNWGIEIANPNNGYRAIRFAGKKKYFVLEADVLGTSNANHTGMFWGNADGTSIYAGSTTGYKTTHQNSTSFHIRDINGNANQETYNPGFSPADGAWHHQKIMATPDGYVRIWIDGDLKFEETGYIPSAEGYLGFINYAGTVRFANIRCRTINEDEAQHYSQHIGNAQSAYANDDRFLKLANDTAGKVGTLVTADNGNTWLNADGGQDLWLNWVSLNNKSSKADLQVGDGNYGAAILTVSGSLGRVGINNYNPAYDLDVIGSVGVVNSTGISLKNNSLPSTPVSTEVQLFEENNGLIVRGENQNAGDNFTVRDKTNIDRLEVQGNGLIRQTIAGNLQDGTYYSGFTMNVTGSSTFGGMRFDRNGTANYRVGLRSDGKFQIANFNLSSGVDDQFVIDTVGKVGIKTQPSFTFHVSSPDTNTAVFDSNNDSGTYVWIRNSDAVTGRQANLGFAPANNVEGARISAVATEDFTTSANRTADLAFWTRLDGTMNERFRIKSNGSVNIADGGNFYAWTTSTTSGGSMHLPRAGFLTFYGDGGANHSISSRNAQGTATDSLRINSYAGLSINLDSNNNNTSGADFTIGRHGGATGTIADNWFHVDGENGAVGLSTTDPKGYLQTGSYMPFNSSGQYLTINHSSGAYLNLQSTASSNGEQIGAVMWTDTNGAADAHRQVAMIDAVVQDSGVDANDGANMRFFTKVAGAASSTPDMTLMHNGDFGVGIETPLVKFHVQEATTEQSRFAYNATNYTAVNYNGFNTVGGNMLFHVSGTEKLRLSGDTLQLRSGNAGKLATLDIGAAEGRLTLSNGSNWGLIARGMGNTPRIGAWTGGSVSFWAANDSQLNSVDTGKGLSGQLFQVGFGGNTVSSYAGTTEILPQITPASRNTVTSGASNPALWIASKSSSLGAHNLVLDQNHGSYWSQIVSTMGWGIWVDGHASDAGKYLFRTSIAGAVAFQVRADGAMMMGSSVVMDTSRNLTVSGATFSGLVNLEDIKARDANGLNLQSDDGVKRLIVYDNGNIVINETGSNADFRVESDLDENMLFVDASANAIGMGDPSPYSADWGTTSATRQVAIRGSSYGVLHLRGSHNNVETRFSIGAGAGNFYPAYDDVNNQHRLIFTPSEAVFNDGGVDYDFRVESDTKPNAFLVNAGTNRVGINTGSPASNFSIKADGNGYSNGLTIEDFDSSTRSAITHVNGTFYFSADGTNDHLYFSSAGLPTFTGGLDVYHPGTSFSVKFGDATQTQYTNIYLRSNSGTGEIWKAGTGYTNFGGASALNIYNSNGIIAFHPQGTQNVLQIDSGGPNIGGTKTLRHGGTTVLDANKNITNIGNVSGTGSYTTDGSNSSGYGTIRITNPKGADVYSRVGGQTGAIKITLPQSWTNTMMWFTIEVFEYSSNESFTVKVGGYNYVGSSSWVNHTATIISNGNVDRNFTVRFAHDGSKCCIFIGDLTSTWSYPQVAVTEFIAGFSNATIGNWHDGWDASFETSSYGTVSGTHYQTDSNIHHTNIKVNGAEVIDTSRNIFPVNIHFGGATNQSFINGGSDIGLYADNVLKMHTYQSTWVERARITDSGFRLKGSSKIEYELSSGSLISHGGYSDAVGFNASYGTYIGGNAGRYVYSGGANTGNGGTHPYYSNGSTAYNITHDGGQINNTYQGQHEFDVGVQANAGLRVTGNNNSGPQLGIRNQATGGTQWQLISNGSGNTDGAGRLQLWNTTQGFAAATFGHTADTDTNFYNRKHIFRNVNIGLGLNARPPGSIASYSGKSGLFWHSDSGNDYGIYRTDGGWSSPNYSQIEIRWVTGIRLDGGNSYGKSGVRLVNNTSLYIEDNKVIDGSTRYITLPDGTVSLPSLHFGTDTDTGFYHPIGAGTADFIGITNGGETSLLISSSDTYHYNESIFDNDSNTSVTSPNITSVETGTTAGTTRYHMNITRSGGTSTSRIGGITSNYYATAYNTSSDYRLKENVNYDWDATTRLKQLRPCQFNWIGDTTNALIDGFLAHEVEDIVQDAVVGEKDATSVVDGETVIDPQSIDQSKLVPLLVKTIQELEARIAALEAQNP